MARVKVGQKVRDIVTGFSGIATGRTEWLTGCATVGIAPQELKDGKTIETQWFDETRVAILDETPIGLLPEEREVAPAPGGPHETPNRGR